MQHQNWANLSWLNARIQQVTAARKPATPQLTIRGGCISFSRRQHFPWVQASISFLMALSGPEATFAFRQSWSRYLRPLVPAYTWGKRLPRSWQSLENRAVRA